MARQDSLATESRFCFSENAAKFGHWQKTKRNRCIREREEIHYRSHERRLRQLLSLVSIYRRSIQVAGGVSVSEFSSKKIRPTRQPRGFFVLRDENKLRWPER